jgi:hypothetical protein
VTVTLNPAETALSVRSDQPDVFLTACAASHADDACVASVATQHGSWASTVDGSGENNCGGSMSEAPHTFLQNPQIIVRCVVCVWCCVVLCVCMHLRVCSVS